MKKALRVLIVEDSGDDAALLVRQLRRANYDVAFERVDTPGAMNAALDKQISDIVIGDYSMPHFSGIDALKLVKERGLDVPFIFVSGTIGEDTAVQAMRMGAHDYIMKGNLKRFVPAVERELREAQVRLERKRAEEALRKSQASLAEAQRIAHLGNWDWDIKEEKLRWSDETYRIFGLAPQQFGATYELFLNNVHPDDTDFVRKSIDEALYEGKPYSLDHRIVLPDGSARIVHEQAEVTFDETGRPTQMLGTVQDITDRKRAEEEISMLAHAVKSISECVNITDMQEKIFFVNEAFLKTYGYEERELIGKPISIVRSESNPPELIKEILPATLRGGWYGELLNRRKDGSEFPTLLSTSIVRDEKGEPVALVGVSSDITERKQVEEHIQRQAALIDIAPEAILVEDLEHHILFWNKGAEQLYGWTREDAIGKKANELLYGQIPPQFEEAEKILRDKGEWRGELHQISKHSGEIIIESRWTLMHADEGTAKSILVVNTDITEKKKLEAQYLRMQRMESIGTLAGGIAHDLNNILAPILMSTQILKRKLPDEQSQRILATVESATQRGAGIVKQVLTFARGAEGERVVLQPKHLINDTAKIMKEIFPKSIDVGMDLQKNLWTVKGDATQFHQVLMNLCVNARDAMPKGGELTIKAENVSVDETYARTHLEVKAGPYLMITVSDTGMGMPRATMERIFEPFFTTKTVGKGTGLGLATVSALVKSHGGFVNVYSEVGKGTRFMVYFPATEVSEVCEAAEEAELPKGSGELVLVVDDEASIRDITKETLEAYSYRVETADDGTEAVALYAEKKREIDVVLTDMMMPYLDGPATIRALQKINPQVKIIAMSGLAASGKEKEVEGAKSFLGKPYTAEKLLKVLHEVFTAG